MNSKYKLIKKWLNSYGIYIFSLVCLILLLIVLIPSYKNTSENKDYVVRSSNAVSRQPVAEQNTSVIFKKNENKAITALLNNYYDSLMGKEGLLLTRYVDDVSRIPEATRRYFASYVYMISNMDVYVADGLIDNSYVVVVSGYQGIKGTGIDVPFLDKFYVLTNVEGNLYISSKEQSESVTVYNELMYETEVIRKLSNKVAVEFDELLGKNPKLQNIFASLGGY